VISRLVSSIIRARSSRAWCSRSKHSGLQGRLEAARIEEEIVVTPPARSDHRFPADSCWCRRTLHTVNGPLPTTRESEAEPSQHVKEMIEASARTERVAVGD